MKTTALSIAFAALAAAGCSPADVDPEDGGPVDAAVPPDAPACVDELEQGAPGFRSGTRLRARVEDGGCGAHWFVTWHDTELGVDCAFARATDGELRCLPQAMRFNGGNVFGDASCSELLYRRADELGLPTADGFLYREVVLATRCDADPFPTLAIHRAPEPGFPAMPAFLRHDDGSCQPFGGDEDATPLGDEVAPSTFVAAELVTETRPGEFGVQVLHAEDGAEQAIRLIRQPSGEPCVPDPRNERCVPVATAYEWEWAYADDTCEAELISMGDREWRPSCGAPALAVRTAHGFTRTCELEFHAVGAPQTPARLYDPYFHAFCHVPSGGEEALEKVFAWAPGERIEGGERDALAPRLDTAAFGIGTLQVAAFVDAAGDPLMQLPHTAWRDHETSAVCTLLATCADSDVRACVPGMGMGSDRTFAEPGCSGDLAHQWSTCPGAAAPLFVASFHGCVDDTKVRPIEGELETVYFAAAESCEAKAAGGWRVGAAQPLSRFGTVVTRVE